MSHEFGHELGLPHEAFQPHNSPIYMSLMSNAYIVGPGGRLDLRAIPKGGSPRSSSTSVTSRSEFPFVLTRCGSCPGRRTCFRSSPAPGGVTLVDWNRNGVFGEEDTIADINYCEGTSPGALHELGHATPPLLSSPTAALIPDDCWCFMVRPER